MPKKVQRTLQDYLSKVKSPRHPQFQSPFNSLSFSSSKNWFLAACKHPRTPSFALNESSHRGGGSSSSNNIHKDDAATLADIDRFLYENFKSLYFRDDEETENNNYSKRVSSEEIQNEAPKLGPIMFESSPRLAETACDLGGSTRFFVKPRMSGSLLVEDALTLTNMKSLRDYYAGSSSTSTITNTDSSSNNSDEHHHDKLPDNCIALLTSSLSPYEDFRRSMQDVVEERSKSHGRVIDWDFMEELLLCYLNLNEKKSHKYILSAFVDLVSAMRRNLEPTAPAKARSVRTVRIGREVTKKTKEVTLEFGSSN